MQKRIRPEERRTSRPPPTPSSPTHGACRLVLTHGAVQNGKNRRMSLPIVQSRQRAAEPTTRIDAVNDFIANAHGLCFVSQEMKGRAIESAHRAPLAGATVVPGDGVVARCARQRAPRPVGRIFNERPRADQHLLLDGRSHDLPPLREREPLNAMVGNMRLRLCVYKAGKVLARIQVQPHGPAHHLVIGSLCDESERLQRPSE